MSIEKKIENIYFRYREDIPTEYIWENEKDRFIELCFCFMAGITKIRHLDLRDIVIGLESLGLLDIDMLAAEKSVRTDERTNQVLSLITNILAENGIEEEDARRCSLVLRKIADATKKTYDGKIQKLIRKYGIMMLQEARNTFSFEEVNEEDLNYILTLWLQNIMELPITMSNDLVRQFCNMNKISSKELEDVADKLDINAAALDDLIQSYMVQEKKISPKTMRRKTSK